jgi:hypothetical protein
MPETTQPFERQERLTSVEEFLQTHRGVLNNRKKVKVRMPEFKFLEK